MNTINLNEIELPKDLHFFILEDMKSFQDKISSDIRELGFTGRIIIADTLESAFDKIDSANPDFILSDWNLPDGQGIGLLEIIRSNSKFNKVPFLMMTTIDDINNILQAVNKGADGYIVKPWDKDSLIENISFAYEKRTNLP